jgi:hypothetical protein
MAAQRRRVFWEVFPALLIAVASCDGRDAGPADPIERVSRALTADSRNVWTNHNDNGRTGATLAETTLTVSNVNGSTFGKVFERSVDDQVYAQPLWLANVPIGGSTRNVLYVATVNGTVYAFDADNPAASTPLASRNLRPAGSTNVRNVDVGQACGTYRDFSGNLSLVGTPVIDVAAGTMFVLVRYKDSAGAFKQELHALDVTSTTLAERSGSPVLITASVPGTGDGSAGGNVAFNSQTQAHRAGLALTGGKVYISWASACDTGPYHGWVIGYDAVTLARTFVWNSSPNGGLAGIWQAGQPPAVDGTGKLYFMTGNGSSTARTGGNAYGHSFVKLDPALASPVASWFTPFDVDSANAADADLGSAGVLIPPDVTTRIIGGGKPGKLFVLNSASLGGFQSGSDSQVVQSFPAAAGHIHGSPVYYNAPGINKKLVYLWSEFDYLKAFEWNAGGSGTMTTTPYRTSTMRVPDGMPGAMLSISANGSVDNTGVLWATHPFSGDANHASQPGILRAFNAKDVSVELWNSKANAADDFGLFGKYVPPTIANGKVFIATHSNKIAVYGLKSASPNLALGKSATASSVEAAGLEASKAVDGSGTTRWSSAFSDPQWIYVDLGSTMNVNQVILKWEAAYATAFQIQVSTDATNWTTVWSTTTGTGGTQTINFTATNARYVRMYGTARGTVYGYSLWELEVYGPAGSGTGTGLRGEYFDNIDLTVSRVVRTDATVNFNWGTGSPDATVGVDTFSARWTGQVEAPETGTFTFCTDTDDGGRLWVNNVQVVNSWVDQALGVQECGTITARSATTRPSTRSRVASARPCNSTAPRTGCASPTRRASTRSTRRTGSACRPGSRRTPTRPAGPS